MTSAPLQVQFVAAGPQPKLAVVEDLQFLVDKGFVIAGICFVDAIAQNVDRQQKDLPLLDVVVDMDAYPPHPDLTYHAQTRGEGAYDVTGVKDEWLSPVDAERQLAEYRKETGREDFLQRTQAWLKQAYKTDVSLDAIADMVQETEAALVQKVLLAQAMQMVTATSTAEQEPVIERAFYLVEEGQVSHVRQVTANRRRTGSDSKPGVV